MVQVKALTIEGLSSAKGAWESSRLKQASQRQQQQDKTSSKHFSQAVGVSERVTTNCTSISHNAQDSFIHARLALQAQTSIQPLPVQAAGVAAAF